MKTINNDSREAKNNDSTFVKEINTLNNKKSSRKFLNYFIPIAFFGYLIYQTILPKLLGNEAFKKYSIVLLVGIIIIGTVVFCSLYFKAVPISENSYEIFDISENFAEDTLYFSYLNSEKKLKKCKFYSNTLLNKLYLTDEDKTYVVVQSFGRNGKITKEVVTKFFCNKNKYNDLSITFSWSKELV